MDMREIVLEEVCFGILNTGKGFEVEVSKDRRVYFRNCDKGVIVADMHRSNNFLPSDDIIVPKDEFALFLKNAYSNRFILQILLTIKK